MISKSSLWETALGDPKSKGWEPYLAAGSWVIRKSQLKCYGGNNLTVQGRMEWYLSQEFYKFHSGNPCFLRWNILTLWTTKLVFQYSAGYPIGRYPVEAGWAWKKMSEHKSVWLHIGVTLYKILQFRECFSCATWEQLGLDSIVFREWSN